MGRFVEGEDRRQQTMLPAGLDDYIAEDNPVRAVDAFIDELDPSALCFERSASGDRASRLSSGDASEDLPLWLAQPHSVEPPMKWLERADST